MMTPYRFAFLRIAFGLYLIGFFYMMFQLSILPDASYVYWGLMGMSSLFLLGYRRQLLARSLVFFSYLLFAFEQPQLNLNSVLVILLLLFFAVVEGNEPWRIKTVDNNNADTRFDENPGRLKIYSISQIVLFGFALTATYTFNIFTRPNFNSWSIWTILVLFFAIIFPQFLVRAKKQTPPERDT